MRVLFLCIEPMDNFIVNLDVRMNGNLIIKNLFLPMLISTIFGLFLLL